MKKLLFFFIFQKLIEEIIWSKSTGLLFQPKKMYLFDETKQITYEIVLDHPCAKLDAKELYTLNNCDSSKNTYAKNVLKFRNHCIRMYNNEVEKLLNVTTVHR